MGFLHLKSFEIGQYKLHLNRYIGQFIFVGSFWRPGFEQFSSKGSVVV